MKGLRSPLGEQLLLTLGRANTFSDCEVHRSDLDRTLDHGYQFGANPDKVIAAALLMPIISAVLDSGGRPDSRSDASPRNSERETLFAR